MEKVLILVPDDRLGGAEQYLKNIAFYFLQNKAEVFVVFLKRQMSGQWEELNDHGSVKFYYTKSRTELSGLKYTFRNIARLRKISFDYVYTSHLHTTSLVGFLIRVKLIRKVNFIGRESTLIFRRFKGRKLFLFKLLYHIGYPQVDLLVNQTDLMREQLDKSLPWLKKKTKLKVIPNPIDLKAINKIQLSASRVHQRDFIVSAGRLIPEKGYDILINSFKEIAEENSNFDLLILGEGQDRQELEEQVKILNLQGRVFLKGHVDNVYDFFDQAEVCVVSSRIEGFPNVLLQMMSQNNKVVSTKCAGGIEELCGVVCVEANDVQALKTGLESALKNELKENRDIFSAQLKDRSVESFQAKIKEAL